MINRRRVMMGAAAGLLTAGTAGSATLTFRWHQTPRRHPFLTDAHLQQLPMPPDGPPRVLFIGNSLLLHHDVPGRVARLAQAEGMALRPALAAANGARLVETMRIKALADVMRPGMWEALVLQDFTRTPLRLLDRVGSLRAMSTMVKRVGPVPVLLFPPWPARAGHPVYRDAGRLTPEPANPEDYAARTMRHYHNLARHLNARVAPVPDRWLEARNPALYVPDRLHASPEGAGFVAEVLWEELRGML